MANRAGPVAGRLGHLAWLLAGLLLSASCGRGNADPTGGETHFLAKCEPNTDSCGSSLTCVCGVCTQPCDAPSACTAFAQAECAPPLDAESCADFRAQGHCEVVCTSDPDCVGISSSHHCERGVCRAVASCVHGQVPAQQVAILGDSFFAATHRISADLQALARSAGALADDAQYLDESNLTANSLSLAGNGIASQYAAATSAGEVKVVVMNGGGADIILGSCDTVDATCPVLVAAAAAARDLLTKMAQDGVLQVVYVFYPDPIDGNTLAKMDALRPLIQSACDNSPVPCHWLDLRPTFAGQYSEYITADGINPTAAGSLASAAAIWATMQTYCVAP
jgi:hypothetical protein